MPNEVVVWLPPGQKALDAEADRKAKLQEVRDAEHEARLAKAENAKVHQEVARVGAQLVLAHLQKWLALANHPDFKDAPGPLEPKDVVKLLALIGHNHRLDNGQATENVAHAVKGTIDFSRMTQEQRDTWRELYELGKSGEH